MPADLVSAEEARGLLEGAEGYLDDAEITAIGRDEARDPVRRIGRAAPALARTVVALSEEHKRHRLDLIAALGLSEADCDKWASVDALTSLVADAVADVVRLKAERDAYKRAKAENDERYMIERDEARAEVARLRDVLGWTNQECPGKCGAKAGDALSDKAAGVDRG